MPLPYLEIQNDNNSFFSAVVLAVLFPVLHDDELFEARCEALFGPSKSLSLGKALLAYSPEHTQLPSLSPLINKQLRLRLAKHLTDNRASFLPFYKSPEALDEESNAIQTGGPLHNIQAAATVLSTWLACTIRVYNNPEQTEFKDYPQSVNPTGIIALLQAGSQFHSLIDVEKLSAEINTQLHSCLKKAAEPPPSSAMARSDLIVTLYKEHFNRLLHTTFASNPQHLAGMHAVYTLCLVPNGVKFETINLEKNTIYLRAMKDKLEYSIKVSSGLKQEGQLTKKELNCTITESFSTVDISRCQAMILNVLFKAGHISQGVPARPVEFIDPFRTPYLTQTEGRVLRLDALPEVHNAQQLISSDCIKLLPSQSIGSGADWTASMAKSTVVTALISTARFDIAAMVTMISMGTIEFGPLALASIPFFLACFTLSMGALAMGKHYAIEYEVAIRTAKTCIDTGNYIEAIKVLDAEFLRWFGARTTRHSFLTKEHYALAHFLRGTCALYDGEQINHKKAYEEYEAAALDAKSANHLSLLLITQLQRIALLKQDSSDLLPKELSPSKIIDQITTELTEYLPDAFADLYWKFNDKVATISQRLLNPKPWDESEISTINQYVLADGAFMLKPFAKGRGQFMGVFFSFFQSTVLAAIHQTKPGYLEPTTIDVLQKQLKIPLSGNSNVQKAPALYFSIQKLRQCTEQLHDFMQQQPKLGAHSDIGECVARIKAFAKGLIAHTHKLNLFEHIDKDLNHILQLLSISEKEISQYIKDVDASIMFLTDLSLDFNQKPYQTIDEFLAAVIAPNSSLVSCVSSTTGDTMLHRLAKLPSVPELKLRVQDAAKRLKASVYARNHCHETPICLLKYSGDPHYLLAIIDAEPMIKLGDELATVDSFLEKTKQDPSVEGHFLLLDGPAGTGKTSTVHRHLAQKGYSVQTWSRGEEIDSRVGGLPTRIKKFFSDAKEEAAKSKKTQILFIDEIDQITPLSKGGATDPQYHNKDADTATFQTEITALKGHRVVLIGATNYPTRLAKPMLSRAETNRIHFPLPNATQRIQLLNFFFRAKVINTQHIEQLAKKAVAYSPRELQGFVDGIKERSISQDMMKVYFNKYARTLTATFKEEFQCADLFMPSFETEEGESAEQFSSNAELAEQMGRLKSEVFIKGNKHTLLYGPPGSGKTTAVRMFAENSGCVLIAIQADIDIPKDELKKVFDRAKQLAPSIIFFDEMHNLAQKGSPHGTFLQTEMDGITKNDITIIGATNYPARIEPAILSRFTSKIELPRLSEEALGKPIKTSLLEAIKDYGAPIYVDSELNNELNHSPAGLSRACDGLDLRHISFAFSCLLGDLKRENKLNAMTYLRMQDVCFSILRKKIQEQLVDKTPEDMTYTMYIQQHKLSFFPAEIPPEGTLAPGFAAQKRM